MENVEKVKPANGQGSVARVGSYRSYHTSSTSPMLGSAAACLYYRCTDTGTKREHIGELVVVYVP